MNRIQLWLTAIVTVALINLAACKKDRRLDPSAPGTMQPDSSKVYLPLKIKGTNSTTSYNYHTYNVDILLAITKQDNYSDTVYTVYVIDYNPFDQLQKLSSFVDGAGISQTQYTLNANGEVIRGDVYNVRLESNDDYEWGENYVPTTLKSYYTLTYNNSNQLTLVSYFHADGQKDYDEFFEYTPEGNISAIHSSATTNLEYDNFKGMGKSVKNAHLFYIEGRDPLLFFTKNNPTRLNETSRTYKYNIDKYPVEMTVKHPDGDSEFKIEYRVK